MDAQAEDDFPHRSRTKDEVLRLVAEHGGSLRLRDLRDRRAKQDLYSVLAKRLGLSPDALTRRTKADPRPAWKQEVRFCRQALVEAKLLCPLDESERGVWQLTDSGREYLAERFAAPLFLAAGEAGPRDQYWEGASARVSVDRFERDPEVRRRCIDHYGLTCAVCGMSFADTYGEVGEGYIHVHHLRPLSEVREAHAVDPVADLRPVCPNCHAMIHHRIPPYRIDEVRAFLGRK